jgi:hypothetical protein
MSIELLAQLEPVAGVPELRDGWRGIVDFGEVWTDADAALWPDGSGEIPRGEPLVYGCEVRLLATDGEGEPLYRAKVVLWSLDERRNVMADGAKLALRDGKTVRATGHLLSVEAEP